MKKLYLLRHAKAANPQGVEDHERPLLEAGKQECKQMNAYLAANNIRPNLVLCSDAVRTMQTAKAVFNGQNDINITPNKKLYNATPGEIIKEIAKIDDKINSLMIVVHNPGIQQLALILAGSGHMEIVPKIKIEYPTCALTEFSFNIDKWKDMEPRTGVLERFVANQ